MADEVFCVRHQKTGPAITAHIPFRGELKEQVLANVCQDAWKEWLVEQVKIINELALNLGDPRSHDIIEQKAREFFGFEGDGYESVEPKPGEGPPSTA
ncbi:MAG TPA: Fe(2+)-trafficking protein [Acidobacteriota bacterium]|jgi:Fe-S cluster biosynthesis and repair protein YggX